MTVPGTWARGAPRGSPPPRPGRAVRREVAAGVVRRSCPLAAYLASWSGWFASPYGYDRNWAAQHGNHVPIWSALDSLYQYQRYDLQFSVGLTEQHPYRSAPWTWPFLSRPVSFFYATPPGCGVKNCSQEVLAIGTPLIWWASVPALLVCLVWWLARRDWRAGAVLAGVAAGLAAVVLVRLRTTTAPSSSSTRWCSTRSSSSRSRCASA